MNLRKIYSENLKGIDHQNEKKGKNLFEYIGKTKNIPLKKPTRKNKS
jgi:hypothetical protein